MTEYEKRYANFLYKFSRLIKIYRKDYNSKLIFLCIGTSKVMGDSFGPLVGDKLQSKINNKNIVVLGDLKDNINALNIEKRMIKVKNTYKNSLVIAIDAALSRKEDIGKINIYPYGINIRKALGENYKEIGDLSIKAIVASDYKKAIDNFIELEQTPFSRIDYLSDIIVNGINYVIKEQNV